MTIDDRPLETANAAIATGNAGSHDIEIDRRLTDRLDTERRLAALASLIAGYEATHGVMDELELVDQETSDRDAAARIRRAR